MADTFTVIVECDSGNEYDGQLGLRISAVFVILIGSLGGCLVPIFLARQSKLHVPKLAFFVIKYFGSGVIIATAFIHLLAPSIDALRSPCIDPDSVIAEYPWTEGICLMTVFLMFAIELAVSRFGDSKRSFHKSSGTDPATDFFKAPDTPEPASAQGSLNTDTAYDGLAAQMSTLFILEFGVIFHSILLGITLAVAGEEFVILYIVVVFHQTFEGLGLGSRFAITNWRPGQEWLSYLLSLLYSLSTPLALGAGLGVRSSLAPGSQLSLEVMGIFDAVSAGILLYTGLVGLIAHDFFIDSQVQSGRNAPAFLALGCMCIGAGLMALLGKWA